MGIIVLKNTNLKWIHKLHNKWTRCSCRSHKDQERELTDFLTQSSASCKEEQISSMKLNQVTKWVSHQPLLSKRCLVISRNSRNNINKDSHQRKELWKDGRNIKSKSLQSKKKKRNKKKREKPKQKKPRKLVPLLKKSRRLVQLKLIQNQLLSLIKRKRLQSRWNTPNQKLNQKKYLPLLKKCKK